MIKKWELEIRMVCDWFVDEQFKLLAHVSKGYPNLTKTEYVAAASDIYRRMVSVIDKTVARAKENNE